MTDTTTTVTRNLDYMAATRHQRWLAEATLKSELVLAFNGGSFTVTKELISFCHTILQHEHNEVVILDDYNNPVKVNLDEFLPQVMAHYFEATNGYLATVQKIRTSSRNADSLIQSLKDE